MKRKWYYAISLMVLVTAVATAASAQPLRSAKVGDSMRSLVGGLQEVSGGPLGSCNPGGPVVSLVDYVAPGMAPVHDNASFRAFTVGKQIVALVAYDESDLTVPVTVYADTGGTGVVTNVWSVDNAPQLCAIIGTVPPQQ